MRPAEYHLGDRWHTVDLGAGSALMTPPHTEVAYRVPGPHELLLIGLPAASPLRIALGEAAPDPAAPPSAKVYETPFVDPAVFMLGHRMWEAAIRGDGLGGAAWSTSPRSPSPPCCSPARATCRKFLSLPAERIVARVREFVEANLERPLGLDRPGRRGVPVPPTTSTARSAT